MSVDLTTTLSRVTTLEVAALNALSTAVPSDAVTYFFYTQESFPYWTNRVGNMGTWNPDTDEEDYPEYSILMRLVIDHLTANYTGQNEANLKTWIPQVKTYFSQHRWLITSASDSKINGLIEARIATCTGFRILQSVGLSEVQVGCEFDLRVRFYEAIEQAFG